jgi:hypothetical protein
MTLHIEAHIWGKPHQEAISQTRSKNMVALRPLRKETCLIKHATYEQDNFTKTTICGTTSNIHIH